MVKTAGIAEDWCVWRGAWEVWVRAMTTECCARGLFFPNISIFLFPSALCWGLVPLGALFSAHILRFMVLLVLIAQSNHSEIWNRDI